MIRIPRWLVALGLCCENPGTANGNEIKWIPLRHLQICLLEALVSINLFGEKNSCTFRTDAHLSCKSQRAQRNKFYDAGIILTAEAHQSVMKVLTFVVVNFLTKSMTYKNMQQNKQKWRVGKDELLLQLRTRMGRNIPFSNSWYISHQYLIKYSKCSDPRMSCCCVFNLLISLNPFWLLIRNKTSITVHQR